MPDTKLLHIPSSWLLARAAELASGDAVLLLHSSDPRLARWVTQQVGASGRVTALHLSAQVLRRLARVPNVEVSETVYPDAKAHGPADVVLLDIPKGRHVARAYLWTAAQALRPQGHLYLAGANAVGAKAVIQDAAALFGQAPILGHKRSHRVAVAVRPETLSVPASWGTQMSWRPQMRAVNRPEGTYTILTMPGIFSWEHLDEGTALLLDYLGAEPENDVLDVGCGYGIIGLAAARAGAHVVLVDDNLLAVRCTTTNVRLNGLDGRCEVLASDLTQAVQERQFDLVLSNPPFHQGVDVSTSVAVRLVREAFDVLRQRGRLRIVANAFLPYDRAMRDVFGNVQVVAENARYRVLEATRT